MKNTHSRINLQCHRRPNFRTYPECLRKHVTPTRYFLRVGIRSWKAASRTSRVHRRLVVQMPCASTITMYSARTIEKRRYCRTQRQRQPQSSIVFRDTSTEVHINGARAVVTRQDYAYKLLRLEPGTESNWPSVQRAECENMNPRTYQTKRGGTQLNDAKSNCWRTNLELSMRF